MTGLAIIYSECRTLDPMMKRSTATYARTRFVAVALFAALLAGCSSDMGEAAAPVSETASLDSAVVVTPLPAFSSTALDGEPVTQGDFEGKPTIMWFWTPWCSVCRGEAPTLSKAARALGGSVDVVGVAALGSVDEMKAFVSDTGIENFTQLADPDAQVWGVFGVASQPAFAFIGANGSIDIVQGSIDEKEILERAATLS
jgi:thiol-disulfide isomerase/thioredoxin